MSINFKNKRIAVIGLGVEGTDIIKYLGSFGSQITVFDQKPQSDLDTVGVHGLVDKYICGPNYLKAGLAGFDYIFRSPGVRPDLPEITEAKQKGAKLSSAIELFFDECKSRIIGVTGTKGKGTTSTLIYEILKRSGKSVYLAGNIGTAYLELLPKLRRDDWVILELSSFQLMEMKMSPHIAVVLNITVDHLDWHKSVEEYVSSKINIVKYQRSTDFVVINADYKTPRKFEKYTKARKYYFSKEKWVKGSFVRDGKIFLSVDDKLQEIGPAKNLTLRGEHNWENVTAAVCASHLAGASLDSISEVIFSFKGLEHRLEYVGSKDGVKFYNDSFATGPQPTIAATRSFNEPITLILGGFDKGLDYSELGSIITRRKNVKNIILIGDLANKIESVLNENNYPGKIINLGRDVSMKDIVKKSAEITNKGGVVLLSPAAASFDMFESYKDRGGQFKKQVLSLMNRMV